MFNTVDLPAPLGPKIITNSPFCIFYIHLSLVYMTFFPPEIILIVIHSIRFILNDTILV